MYAPSIFTRRVRVACLLAAAGLPCLLSACAWLRPEPPPTASPPIAPGRIVERNLGPGAERELRSQR